MVRKLAILLMAGLFFLTGARQASAASPPPLRGKAVLLMDSLTGQILYQQNGTMTNFPASTTKLLTALVAVEHGRLDQTIRVSREAVNKGPDSASCYISEGEEQPLEYLLYGLLIPSGNDCADAIADGLTGGKPEQFLTWMNETAKRVGATGSHFNNAHGLHDPNHYTTAQDLAFIARAAMANPVIQKITATKEFVWPGKNNGTYYNHNNLLWSYPDPATGKTVLGGKTGYTEYAGFTLVTAAEQHGRQLIGVSMGYDNKAQEFQDMELLLDYGFDNFVRSEVVKVGAPQGEIPVNEGKAPKVPIIAASSFAVTRPKSGPEKVTVMPKLQPDLKAPLGQGQQVGVLEVHDGERVLGTVPLVTKEAMAARSTFWQSAGRITLAVLKWIGIIAAGLVLFRFTVKTIRRILRRRRRALAADGYGRSATARGMISSYRTRSYR